jgi:hypothetical protein
MVGGRVGWEVVVWQIHGVEGVRKDRRVVFYTAWVLENIVVAKGP